MNFELLIPITLFICIAYAIKSVVDARVRRQMVESNGSQELVKSILEGDEVRRRQSSLRWGIVLVALGIGFAAIAMNGMDDLTPGTLAILLSALGLGNLAAYAVARKLPA